MLIRPQYLNEVPYDLFHLYVIPINWIPELLYLHDKRFDEGLIMISLDIIRIHSK